MKYRKRRFGEFTVAILGSTAVVAAFASMAGAFDWTPYQEDSTIEIITLDEDGDRRETKIWIVVLDESGFIRTNDSRWLANIQRGSTVWLRTRDVETPVAAEITDDSAVYERVEQAFKDKYGGMQKVMSLFRMSRPTVLRVSARTE